MSLLSFFVDGGCSGEHHWGEASDKIEYEIEVISIMMTEAPIVRVKQKQTAVCQHSGCREVTSNYKTVGEYSVDEFESLLEEGPDLLEDDPGEDGDDSDDSGIDHDLLDEDAIQEAIEAYERSMGRGR